MWRWTPCAMALLCLGLALAMPPPLIVAVKSGDLAKVQALLESDVDVDEQDGIGSTALMWAADKKSTEMAKAILEKNPKLNTQNADGWSALMFAARHGTTEMVKAILEKNPKLNTQNADGWSALMIAAWYDSPEMVKAILGKNPKLNTQTADGWSALMIAAKHDTTEMVKAILEKNPKLNTQNAYGWSALMIAAMYGSPEIVEALLEKKPDVNLQAYYGVTALHIASERGHLRCAKKLLDFGASVDVPDFAGRTPLFLAASFGQNETVNLLLDHGAHPERIARNGQTPLEKAKETYRWCHSSYSSCHRFEDTVKSLEEKTPKGLALLQKMLSSQRLQLLMLLAMVSGLILGDVWHCAASHEPSQTSGARKLAIKAVAKNANKHMAIRAMEVVACLMLPLGLGMLWLRAKVTLGVYVGVYIAPRLLELKGSAFHQPIRLLVGLPRKPGCFNSRTPRVLATLLFLVVAALMPLECEEEMNYLVFGNAPSFKNCNGPLASVMIRGGNFTGPPMLNRATSQLACPRYNAMPHSMQVTYYGVLGSVWLISLVWLLLTVLEMLNIIQAEEGLTEVEEKVVKNLQEKLANTNSAEEVSQVEHEGFRVKAERSLVCFPFPGGFAKDVIKGLAGDFTSFGWYCTLGSICACFVWYMPHRPNVIFGGKGATQFLRHPTD